jgi:hypothetical protein
MPSFRWDPPGFILQVDAMKQEENTDALAELLRQENFLAVVIKHNIGHSYRVVVGP